MESSGPRAATGPSYLANIDLEKVRNVAPTYFLHGLGHSLLASRVRRALGVFFIFYLFLQKCLSPSNKTFDDHYSVVVFNLHLFERHVISLCWLTGVRFVERGSLSSSYFSSSLFGLWNRMS